MQSAEEPWSMSLRMEKKVSKMTKGIEKFTLDSFCQQSEKYLNYREPLLSVIFNNYFFNQFNYLIHNGRKKRNDQKRHEHKVKIKYLEAINN